MAMDREERAVIAWEDSTAVRRRILLRYTTGRRTHAESDPHAVDRHQGVGAGHRRGARWELHGRVARGAVSIREDRGPDRPPHPRAREVSAVPRELMKARLLPHRRRAACRRRGRQRARPWTEPCGPRRGAGHAPARRPPLTMDAIHAAGGVPPGWRFTLFPATRRRGGKPSWISSAMPATRSRASSFRSSRARRPWRVPDLTGMGRHHPTEYLVESLVNPSAVLIDGPGYVGATGARSCRPRPP